MESPNASWSAPTSMKGTSKKSERIASRRPWPCLVRDDVGALRGVDGDAAERVREELEARPIVEGVEVVAAVGQDRQRLLVAEPSLERRALNALPGPQHGGERRQGLPVVEFRRERLIRSRDRRWLDLEGGNVAAGQPARLDVPHRRAPRGKRIVGRVADGRHRVPIPPRFRCQCRVPVADPCCLGRAAQLNGSDVAR